MMAAPNQLPTRFAEGGTTYGWISASRATSCGHKRCKKRDRRKS